MYSTVGDVQYTGDIMGTVGGYHEYSGVFSTQRGYHEDIMINLGEGHWENN